jgi:hypothetical protein
MWIRSVGNALTALSTSVPKHLTAPGTSEVKVRIVSNRCDERKILKRSMKREHDFSSASHGLAND